MQRPNYSAGPAHSPPLHHPVPQHVSTVPQLRSPPPPSYGQNNQQHMQGAQQATYAYGRPDTQNSGNGGAYTHPAFKNFMDGPTAQLGFQMGQSAMNAGQNYAQQNFDHYVNVSALKHSFSVSNSYVLRKLTIVIFPWRHRPWSRQQTDTPGSTSDARPAVGYMPPREDVNAPDMYIPLMAFITYILLSTLIAGTNGAFKPQLLGITFSNASIVVGLELVVLFLGRYFLNISSQSQLFDLVAYSGYKFVGVILTICASAIFAPGPRTRIVGWLVFTYTFSASAFFLLRSLRYVLLPSDGAASNPGTQPISRSQRIHRMQFLVFYTYVVQFVLMWWLSSVNVGEVVRAGRGNELTH